MIIFLLTILQQLTNLLQLLLVELDTYEKVVKYDAWKKAMKEEITALEDNETWLIVKLPADKHVIGRKWKYKIKLRENGSAERCKTRLVPKQYSQI